LLELGLAPIPLLLRSNSKNGDFHLGDFSVKLAAVFSAGWPKEELENLLGSHWTMKVWSDGNLWGGHMTCMEHPEFNCFEVMTLGVEKTVDHPVFGGKAKASSD